MLLRRLSAAAVRVGRRRRRRGKKESQFRISYPRVSLASLLKSPLECSKRIEKASEMPEHKVLHKHPRRIGAKHWSCFFFSPKHDSSAAKSSSFFFLTIQRPLRGSPGLFRGARNGQLLQGRGQVTHCRRRRHVSEHVDGAAAARRNGFVFGGGGGGDDGRGCRTRPLPIGHAAASAAPGARGRQGPRGLPRSSDDDIVLLGVVHFLSFELEKRESGVSLSGFASCGCVFFERGGGDREIFLTLSLSLQEKKRRHRRRRQREEKKRALSFFFLSLFFFLSFSALARTRLLVSRARRRERYALSVLQREERRSKLCLPSSIASASLFLFFHALDLQVLLPLLFSLPLGVTRTLVMRPERPREETTGD